MKRLGFAVASMLGVACLTAEAHAYDYCARLNESYALNGVEIMIMNDANISWLGNLLYWNSGLTWNDRISGYSLPKDSSHYSVIQFYTAIGYGGGILQDNSYGGAKSVAGMPSGWDNAISSIKCHVVPMKQVGANP